MKNKFYTWLANVDGGTSFEYAFIAGAIGMVLIAGTMYFSDNFTMAHDIINGYMSQNIKDI